MYVCEVPPFTVAVPVGEMEPLAPAEDVIVKVPACAIANVEVTDVFAFKLIEQTPVPVHTPDQPVNVEPVAGLAVRVTVPCGRVAEHVPPQLMPVGFDVTVPAPAPDLATKRVYEVDTTTFAIFVCPDQPSYPVS